MKRSHRTESGNECVLTWDAKGTMQCVCGDRSTITLHHTPISIIFILLNAFKSKIFYFTRGPLLVVTSQGTTTQGCPSPPCPEMDQSCVAGIVSLLLLEPAAGKKSHVGQIVEKGSLPLRSPTKSSPFTIEDKTSHQAGDPYSSKTRNEMICKCITPEKMSLIKESL